MLRSNHQAWPRSGMASRSNPGEWPALQEASRCPWYWHNRRRTARSSATVQGRWQGQPIYGASSSGTVKESIHWTINVSLDIRFHFHPYGLTRLCNQSLELCPGMWLDTCAVRIFNRALSDDDFCFIHHRTFHRVLVIESIIIPRTRGSHEFFSSSGKPQGCEQFHVS